MIRKSKAEIIEMVRARYQHPANRSFDTARQLARYTHQGKMCPLGMCMEKPHELPEELNGLHVGQLVCVLDPKAGCSMRELRRNPSPALDRLLKPEYRGHPVGFWEDMQLLHDANSHFDEQGYSPRGIRFINRVRQVWTPYTRVQSERTLALPRREVNIRFKRP